ncbi:MAG: RNA polymerase sigma factor [Acidimicrobiia bacterium]|nr:RNA polymerase sigma factor [Acidimicrobiia bacterium]
MTYPSLDHHRTKLATNLDGAYPAFVAAVQHRLYGGILRLVGNPERAADAAQDTLVRAYRALDEYPPERIRALRLEGWLWTIALNVVRNEARSRRRRPVVVTDRLPDDPAGGRGPEQSAIDAETSAVLLGALGALPIPMRESVVLRHVLGLTYPEIAESTGRPLGTVKSDVRRGLARLARETKGRFVD